jgi:hypothetical protein
VGGAALECTSPHPTNPLHSHSNVQAPTPPTHSTHIRMYKPPPHQPTPLTFACACTHATHAHQVRQFWFLKRKARRGVPLLRSLQGNTNSVLAQQSALLQTERKKFHYIRRILEKTRMLVGLVVRREKFKADMMSNSVDAFTQVRLLVRVDMLCLSGWPFYTSALSSHALIAHFQSLC